MFTTRMLARLLVFALGAILIPTLAAEEPAAPPPPAKSIREWKTTPGTVPAAQPAPARSIREWRVTPSATPGPCPTASPMANPSATTAANPPAKRGASAAVPTAPLTISLTSKLRQGKLVVELDDVPIFAEKFQKSPLAISQTTTWDALKVAAGSHRLSAMVHGTKKKYFSKSYDLQLSGTKEVVLRFVMQGDKLTVEMGS